MSWPARAILSAFFALLTAAGLIHFPGHTFLMSDTQIYLPLFAHLEDPSLLNKELILEGAHLSYTIYDEVTLGLRAATGLDFESVLLAQQALFRWLGLWGAFLLARACGLGLGASVLSSSILWLGVLLLGPAVVTTEYEPVPRGFAVPLVVFSLGALASGWRWWGAAALAVAFLYHAPAVWPLVLVALFLRDRRTGAAMLAAGALLFALAKLQPGVIQSQPFFSLVDTAHRQIMQTRASYNWISLWQPRYIWMYLLTGALALLAYRRLRQEIPAAARPYFLWVPLIGLATMPLSYLLLEGMGWALLPQIQPMRALLYCHLFCQWLGAIAAGRAAQLGRWWEAASWLLIPLSLSLRPDLLEFRPNDWRNEAILAALALACAWVATRWPRRELAFLLALALPLAYGEGFQARTYKTLENQPLRDLSQWASTRTPKDSVFLFADLGRRLEPGIFRARANRAVYVCWKQGGQVNYFPQYSNVWWERWTQVLAPGHAKMDYADLRRRGVQYLVLTSDTAKEYLTPVYVSPKYRVYDLASR
jgi:hypothetical protein